MVVTLKNGGLTAQVASRGAELLSLKDAAGNEYMWQKDPKYWDKTSPVLFPIVGNLRGNKVTFQGVEYEIAKHGICRAAEFTLVEQSDTTVAFNYQYNEETLKKYPYKFSLTLAYTLSETGITIRYTVKNVDDKEIDFTFGAHPGFNVPVDGVGKFEDYCLEFEKAEPDGCPVFDFEKNQINMDNRADFTKGTNKIMLNYDYFDNDAIIFDKVRSNSVKLYNVNNGHGVKMDFADFDFIAFWTPIKAGGPMLCMEPWCGMSVCSDEGDTFEEKRGCRHLALGESKSFDLTISPIL